MVGDEQRKQTSPESKEDLRQIFESKVKSYRKYFPNSRNETAQQTPEASLSFKRALQSFREVY